VNGARSASVVGDVATPFVVRFPTVAEEVAALKVTVEFVGENVKVPAVTDENPE